VRINRLLLPLAKAVYLLSYSTGPGTGGDKRKFWREVMGYQSPEALRAVLLAHLTVEQLQLEGQDVFGAHYQAIVTLTGSSGASWQIRTCWIVLPGEDVARFVTAFPERRRQS
jgi:hypothetical protein